MKQKTLSMAAIAVGLLCSRTSFAADGKALFLSQKCNLCHSVPTAGIEKTTKSEKVAGPDIVNLKLKAATLTKYLQKEADINGKKHPKACVLPEADMTALVDWMVAQKK